MDLRLASEREAPPSGASIGDGSRDRREREVVLKTEARKVSLFPASSVTKRTVHER